MLLDNGDLRWTVESFHPPMRVDQYLKTRLPSYPRTAIQRYIREGGVMRVGSRSGKLMPLKPASKVRPGDMLHIHRPSSNDSEWHGPTDLPPVVYEDATVLVVDKPAGMLVHPSGARTLGTVIGLMRERYGAGVDLAHRIDRETSGLLVLTRGREATRAMKSAFKHRRVKKRYLALTLGIPPWESTTVNLPIGPAHGPVRVRQTVREDGMAATTHFRLLCRVAPHHAIVAAEPITGRLHQIRVHLEALGFPVFGDKIYGNDGTPFLQFYARGLTPGLVKQLGHWRHALHAAELRFMHPLEKREIHVQAPLPDDLVDLIVRLARAGDVAGSLEPPVIHAITGG